MLKYGNVCFDYLLFWKNMTGNWWLIFSPAKWKVNKGSRAPVNRSFACNSRCRAALSAFYAHWLITTSQRPRYVSAQPQQAFKQSTEAVRLQLETFAVLLKPVWLCTLWPNRHVFFFFFFFLQQQQRLLQRGSEGGDFRRNAWERDVRHDAGEPVGEEQRRDPEERGRDQTVHHQPEGCGEVHQIRGHGPEPSLHPGKPQVNTAAACTVCRCWSWMLLLFLSAVIHVEWKLFHGTDPQNRLQQTPVWFYWWKTQRHDTGMTTL